jgi:Tfp pilus assembly protein PilN
MRVVNLLPESYFRRVARRSAFRRNIVLGCVLFGITLWCFTASHRAAGEVNRQVLTEQRRLNQEQEQGRDLARLTAQHGDFRVSEDLLSELEEPVPVVAILAALARAVPEEVVLNRMVVDAPHDVRVANGAAGTNAAGTARATARPVKIELGGLAHTDREVVSCLSRIAEQPLFANVKLGKSRHIQESRSSKVAFQITLDVPVNREVIVAGKDRPHGD